MKNSTKLQVRNWNGKNFTSSAELVDLFRNKCIKRISTGKVTGMHWWRESFEYYTHDGRFIASIEHNSDFMPSTQAYGIEVKVTSLVSEFKQQYRSKVFVTDLVNRAKMPYCFYRLSKGLTAMQDLEKSRN